MPKVQTKTWKKGSFHVSTDKSLLQIARIHKFLCNEAYWCLGIPKKVVRQSIEHSLCFGLYEIKLGKKKQVGYARVVTDSATFAWLCDVYIEQDYRGQELSKWLMSCVLAHPSLKNLRRVCLATKDAHELYKQFGFEVTTTAQNWMEIKDNDIYKRPRNP